MAQVSKKTSLPIVGGGGLCNGEDALMIMVWGATMVTFCTSIMWYGWEVVRETVKGMGKYLKEKNLTYEQIIGKSLQYLRSSSELEAVEKYPVIDYEKCTGCGQCLLPGHCNSIELINNKAVSTDEKCLECGICAELCKFGAIDY